MKLKKFAATAVLTIASLGVAAGTANAAPVHTDAPGHTPPATQVLPGIYYTANIENGSVVLRTSSGSLAVKDGQLQILDAQKRVTESVPLSIRKGDLAYPISAKVDGLKATLTPNLNKAAATPIKPVALPLHQVDAQLTQQQQQQQKQNSALSTLTTQIGAASAVGGLLGTIVGGLIGLALGPAGMVTLAGIGGVAGTIIVGGPALIASAVQYFQTMG
ncbi:hypothetical protein G4X40_08500 [Rhodococcus sp. D2-41]|uniref:hypothetical protein n=1 Tax=Speluncibacter jeojiensis TaxID=2710754 RepID=UPI00240FCFF3|nr:hypothetical protein [Rhodococcus sp. D2-41]MDG3010191.1 hypothetical protein [Rhodococcus sp. D2-41]